MNQKLYSENLQLSLDIFIQKMSLLNKAEHPQLVAKIVIKWTKGQPLLTKKLLQYILRLDTKIIKGTEEIAVEQTIRNYLLKEFKHDDLTLCIRKSLYQKDLDNILEKNKYVLDRNAQIYLSNAQKNLGLTNQERASVEDDYTIFKHDSNIRASSQLVNQPKRHRQLFIASNQIEHSDLKPKEQGALSLSNQSLITRNQKYHSPKISESRWLWLLLGIPVLILGINNIPRLANIMEIGEDSALEPQNICIDLASRESPRMSLGDKLLTKAYSHLKPASTIAFYEGINAFARCEFAVARQKFAQTLDFDKNNPEALVYYNNSIAIAKEHFKIAVSIPLGSKPDIAWEILRGVAQAQDEINQQGGVQNKLLLVQIVNDDNDPQVVKQVARELATDKSLLAAIAHNDSNSSIAAASTYQRHKLVAISPTSTSTKLSGIGSYILRTIPSVSALANKLADYASVKSLKEIAVCSDSSDSASKSFVREFESQTIASGGEIKNIPCDFAKDNYQADSFIKETIAQNADAILVAPSVNQMDKAIAIAQANQQRLPLLGNHSLYTYKTIAKGEDAIAGMVIPAPWMGELTTNSDFVQTSQEYWGGSVNWRTAMAYDATGAIIQGLQGSSTRSQLQSILTQPEFIVDGATGRFQFEKGDRLGQVQLAHIKKSEENPARYNFAPLDLQNN